MPKGVGILRGFVTFKEIALHLNICTDTLREKIAPLRPFLMNGHKRKKLYSPSEWKIVIAYCRKNGFDKKN